jgi:hypothetical protein
MARRWVALALIAGLLAAYGIGRALSPGGPVTVAILGDHADDLRAALGVDQTVPATITLVTLNRWSSLDYIPDLAALCADACGSGKPAQVSVVQMRFGQVRKVVFFHLPSFGGFPAAMNCVTARARQELLSMRLRDPLPCGSDITRDAVWLLPAGLGRL